MKKQILVIAISCASILSGVTATAADTTQVNKARAQFTAAFNERNWEAVTGIFASDAVFHRMNADTIYNGPEEIVARFKDTIAGEWNVKFTRLSNTGTMAGVGDNTMTVDAGNFAVTAGADSDACYAGFYTMTWNKEMKIQVFNWQDVQADSKECQE